MNATSAKPAATASHVETVTPTGVETTKVEPMNKQAIVDWVYKFLVKQGEPSIAGGGMCRYKDDRGNRCAIGCLLPDDDPILGLNTSITALLTSDTPNAKRLWKVLGIDNEVDVQFLSELQQTHDYAATDRREALNWTTILRRRFLALAERWELRSPTEVVNG